MADTRWGWSRTALIAVAALGVLLTAAIWIRTPGYTDADYYMATGIRLAEGFGLSEPFVWNYLAGVRAIPHPSHLYWMPLTSFLAALPMTVLKPEFRYAQAAFILAALMIPPLTGALARELGASRRQSVLAGWLAVFPGFFLPYLVTTDAFGLYALIGAGALLSLGRMSASGRWQHAGLAGVLIGLAHLTRADGLLFLLPAAIGLVWREENRGRLTGVLIGGYLLVMGPWMLRLWMVSGSLLPPGGAATAYLTGYDELFSYPASHLTPAHALSAGVGRLLRTRLQAAGQNLLSFIGVNGLVFLTPLLLWGGWRRRQRELVRLTAIYAVALFAVMSFIFPFPGVRGGFFHSSAALMPVLWPLAVLGLDDLIERLGPARGWRTEEAKRMFGPGAVLIAIAVTTFLLWTRLVQREGRGNGWNSSARTYEAVGSALEALEADPGLVAVNNPPGFWLATRLRSVVIPDGGEAELVRVVEDFGVEWVVLERNHPVGLAEGYEDPGSFHSLELVSSLDPAAGSAVHLLKPKVSPP